MAANLTPGYRRAEAAFRRAANSAEEYAALQEMLRELPKHKGTDKLHADLKSRLARLREAMAKESRGPTRVGFRLARQGIGRVVLLGGPNSGKSQLLAKLTRARPAIGEHPFTTVAPLPGMMTYEDVAIQLVDLPPVMADGYSEVIRMLVRSADLVLLLADVGEDEGIDRFLAMREIIAGSKQRVGERSYFDPDDVGVSYTRGLLVLSRCDLPGAAERESLYEELGIDLASALRVSSETGEGLDELCRAIFASLEVIRVYTRPPGSSQRDPSPITLPIGGTVRDLAESIHLDLARRCRGGKLWRGAELNAVPIPATQELQDGDTVEIVA